MDSESRAQSQSSAEPKSDSKILVGQKIDIMETEETSESSSKRVKLSDLESVYPSQANAKEKNKPIYLDLNAEDISSSINNDPFYPFNHLKNLQKSRNDSECESTVGPPHEKDPMTVWKGLKQNNYMSAQREALSMPAQKTRARKKNNNDIVKRKTELVKKEHVDRFAKVAAPSGLLNGLNPGIINHVRNKKQVHSIIEALVGSERSEIQQGNGIKNRVGELTENNGGLDRFEEIMKCEVENKPEKLGLMMSSCVTVGSENMSCLSAEESGNLKSVTSLSFKAANVASQWLDLLNQDIRGRLAALRRSKKRVQSVITTELPDLIMREFSNNAEKDSNETKSSTLGGFDKASADAHAVRWNTLFGQMDKSLSDEESHLENWLNQVKEMQLHCESGLRNSLDNASQESFTTGNHNRLGEAHNSEMDLDVSAAAASIYSTCNFLLTMENLPCS